MGLRSLPSGAAVLITGSTSGIGLSIAVSIAMWSPSAHIGLNGFGTPEEIQQAIATVERARSPVASRRDAPNGTTFFVVADLSTADGASSVVEKVVKRVGRIDVLINNAGIQHAAPIDDFPIKTFEKVLAVNLSAVWHTTRTAIPHMKRQKFGRIINVASVHGLQASPNKSAYVAAKHGVVGLTKAVALEVSRTGCITCNAVCPGWVLTPLVEQQIRARMARKGTSLDAETASLVGEKMPSQRAVEAEELGNATCYFASPTSVSSNGTILTVDGGWTAGTIGATEPVVSKL